MRSSTAKRTRAYVDTGALIAFLDRSDTYHPLFRQLFSDPPRLLTTPLVIAEGQGWFLKRYDSQKALEFLGFIEELKVLEIIKIGAEAIRGGARFLRRFSDQELTLTDACGLWLMEEEKISICWSADRHLALTGVSLAIYE